MVFNRNDDGNGLNIMGFLGNDKVKYFVAGAVCAYAVKKIAETDAAHDFAVNLTAGALDLKDSVEESIENIREDAEDIHAEAQEKHQIEIFGPEDLEDLEDLEEYDDEE